MKPRIYLDYNATWPLAPAARRAMSDALGGDFLGNPSSVHGEGRRARDLVERARNSVATLMGRPREQIVFTSGGTEANLHGVATLAAVIEAGQRPRVVATTRIEHPSVQGAVQLLGARGWDVRWLPVSARGEVADDGLEGASLVALGLVNHELGTLVSDELLATVRQHGALLHVDAVQAAGKRALAAVPADSMAISAHKLGGPQGVGAVALTIEAERALEAGHQERGRRPGTENTLAIIGFGAAASGVDPSGWSSVADLGERLEAGLLALPYARVHGAGAARIGGTINAGFGGCLGESIVIALDLAGVAVSTGAACMSGSVAPSPVLLALGLSPAQAKEAVRFSLGPLTTPAEIEHVLSVLPPILDRVRTR